MSLDADIANVKRKLEGLANIEVPRAYASATNKIMGKIKTQIVAESSRALSVKAGLVRKRVFVKRASARNLRGALTVYHSDIPGIAVKPDLKQSRRYNARGRMASNKIKIGNQTFTPAFVNLYGNQSNRKLHVLYRTTKKRYPIKLAMVPLKADVEKRALPIAQRLMGNEFQKIVFSELIYREGKHVS